MQHALEVNFFRSRSLLQGGYSLYTLNDICFQPTRTPSTRLGKAIAPAVALPRASAAAAESGIGGVGGSAASLSGHILHMGQRESLRKQWA